MKLSPPGPSSYFHQGSAQERCGMLLLIVRPLPSSLDKLLTQGTAWGGQIGATPRNATSFAHRDALYSYQLASTSGTEAFPEANMKFINDMWTSIAGSDKKKPQYTNYIDPTLDAESWPVAYYGENFQRLTQLKRVYDPDNLFRNNQSIPVYVPPFSRLQ
jgi:FAD/FMN-containing dehydrogenase